jgi:hypothetical protein
LIVPSYCIESALPEESAGHFSTNLGGPNSEAPAWGIIYHDSWRFDAEDDAAAVDIAESLQRQHDGAFLMLCGGLEPSGWDLRPCYLDSLYRICPTDGLVRVSV